MLNWRAHWPKWLFFVTLCFGLFSLGISYVKEGRESSFAYNTQILDNSLLEYENIVNALPELKSDAAETTFMSFPVTAQSCNKNMIGRRSCSLETKLVEQEIQQPQVSDPAVQRELDPAKSKMTDLLTDAKKSQSDLTEFQPIYDLTQNMMKPVVSIIVLLASLIIILSKKYKADTQKWAFGSLGTILGFWLR